MEGVDAIDQKILAVLSADARCSASEVGRRVGLSAPATGRRIRRLEESGLIRGYAAVVDPRAAEASIEAFVELRFPPGTQVAEVDSALADLPEVIESFTLAGDPDALAHVQVRDIEHLKRVVDQIRRGRPRGAKVVTTRTLIVLGRTKHPAR